MTCNFWNETREKVGILYMIISILIILLMTPAGLFSQNLSEEPNAEYLTILMRAAPGKLPVLIDLANHLWLFQFGWKE